MNGWLVILMTFILPNYGMEDKNDVEDSGKNSKNICGEICNFLKDKGKDLDTTEIIKRLDAKINTINGFNAIKIRFFLDGLDESKLKLFYPSCFKIEIQNENGEPIENILSNWNGEVIHNGTPFHKIKKSFGNKYGKLDYTLSLKILDINKISKIKIKIDYNTKQGGKIFSIKDENGNDVIDLKLLLSTLPKDKEKLIDIIKSECYCKPINNNPDGIKICFKNDGSLNNNNIKNCLTIYIEDEKGNPINEIVFTNWSKNKPIVNGMKLSEIKSSLFTTYTENIYGPSDPSSFSLRFDNKKYNKVKIAIKYLDDKFYVKCNDSEVIDLSLFGSMNKKNNNINAINNQMPEEEYMENVKKMFESEVICCGVGFKNSIKLKFKDNEKLLGDNRRKNFKLFVLDENDVVIDEIILKKWVNYEDIPSGTPIADIKRLFFLNSKNYPNNKPFELSMRYNQLNGRKKIKLKVSYGNDLYTYVKYNDSDIIDLEKLETEENNKWR